MSQSINLIPQSEVKEQKKEQIVKFSSILSVLLLLVVAGVAAYYWYQVYGLRQQVSALEIRIESSRSEVSKLADIEVLARTLDAKYQIVEEIFASRRSYANLLSELNKRIPSNITVESFGISGDNNDELNLAGYGADYIAIARFLDTLSDTSFDAAGDGYEKLFTDVSLNSVMLDGQSLRVSYSIVVKFDDTLLR